MRSQLASATQNLQQAEDMRQAPDMEEAINILKRSSLEVELAAKEKEVRVVIIIKTCLMPKSLETLRDTSKGSKTMYNAKLFPTDIAE